MTTIEEQIAASRERRIEKSAEQGHAIEDAARIRHRWTNYPLDELQRNWNDELRAAAADSSITAVEENQLIRWLAERLGARVGDVRRDLATARRAARGGLEPESHNDWAILAIENWPAQIRTLLEQLWDYDPERQLWVQTNEVELERQIMSHSGNYCRTRGDYKSILGCIRTLHDFGEGNHRHKLAIRDTVYEWDGTELIPSPLTPEHFCRFKIDEELMPLEDAPVFSRFLEDTFGDHEDRRTLFAKHIFAAIFGLGNAMQKAFLWYGVTGSGKTTAQRILKRLMPDDLVASVKPSKFDQEYMIAAFANKPLNLAGELDRNKALDEHFLEVIGDEAMMTGRNPYGKPFTFQPMTTHIFNSNELPNTMANNAAFFRRWSVLLFERRVPESQIIQRLSEQVELGAVVKFALDTVKDGRGFHLHDIDGMDQLREQWEKNTNSSMEFIHDDEYVELTDNDVDTIACSDLYDEYNRWCRRFGKHARVRNSFYSDLSANPQKPPRKAVLRGRNVFRGIRIARGAEEAPDDLF